MSFPHNYQQAEDIPDDLQKIPISSLFQAHPRSSESHYSLDHHAQPYEPQEVLYPHAQLREAEYSLELHSQASGSHLYGPHPQLNEPQYQLYNYPQPSGYESTFNLSNPDDHLGSIDSDLLTLENENQQSSIHIKIPEMSPFTTGMAAQKTRITKQQKNAMTSEQFKHHKKSKTNVCSERYRNKQRQRRQALEETRAQESLRNLNLKDRRNSLQLQISELEDQLNGLHSN